MHGSWRRAALLALIRSEVSPELLTRAADYLLADRGALLRELIRVVIAVESEPAVRLFASIGMDPATIPTNLHVPSGPSWYRLIAVSYTHLDVYKRQPRQGTSRSRPTPR